MIVFLDFETRSRAKLKIVGGRNYAEHPSTEMLCAVAVVVGGGRASVHCWSPWQGPPSLAPRPPLPPPARAARRKRPPELDRVEWAPPRWGVEDPPREVLDAVAAGAPIVAHNAHGFDRHVWDGLGFPPARWLDTTDRASRASLPRALEQIGQTLYDRGKDEKGRKVMLAHAVPKRPKQEGYEGEFQDPATPSVGTITRYCALDTLLTVAVFYDFGLGEPHVDDPVLEAHERIDARGVPIDLDYVRRLRDAERRVVSAAVRAAAAAVGMSYDDALATVGSPQKLAAWLAERGVKVADAKAETIGELVAGEVTDPGVLAILDARLAVANVVGGKIRALLELTSPDRRYRGWSSYHKANTGRWTGKGAQMQNFPRAAD